MIRPFQAHRCTEQLFVAKNYITGNFDRNFDREGPHNIAFSNYEQRRFFQLCNFYKPLLIQQILILNYFKM